MKPQMLVLCVLPLAACAPDDLATRTDVLRGEALFAQNCASCHGADASGAGPASLGLGAPPPSLKGLSAGNGGVFPRDRVLATIDGLSRKDHPSAAMPEFGAGDLGPLVQVEDNGLSVPIPADLLALTNYLESIQDR